MCVCICVCVYYLLLLLLLLSLLLFQLPPLAVSRWLRLQLGKETLRHPQVLGPGKSHTNKNTSCLLHSPKLQSTCQICGRFFFLGGGGWGCVFFVCVFFEGLFLGV